MLLVLCRGSLGLVHVHQDFLLCFCTSGCTCRPMIQLELIFVYSVSCSPVLLRLPFLLLLLLHRDMQTSQPRPLGKLSFLHMCTFISGPRYFILLMCLNIFTPIPASLGYCSLTLILQMSVPLSSSFSGSF